MNGRREDLSSMPNSVKIRIVVLLYATLNVQCTPLTIVVHSDWIIHRPFQYPSTCNLYFCGIINYTAAI